MFQYPVARLVWSKKVLFFKGPCRALFCGPHQDLKFPLCTRPWAESTLNAFKAERVDLASVRSGLVLVPSPSEASPPRSRLRLAVLGVPSRPYRLSAGLRVRGGVEWVGLFPAAFPELGGSLSGCDPCARALGWARRRRLRPGRP